MVEGGGRSFALAAAVAYAVTASPGVTLLPGLDPTSPAPQVERADPVDARGRLDLAGVRLEQTGGRIVATFSFLRPVPLRDAGRHGRRICLAIRPPARRGHARRICRTAAAATQAGPAALSIRFRYRAAGLGPGPVRWSAATAWPGRFGCRRTCRDRLPDHGWAAWTIRRERPVSCVAAGESRRFSGPRAGRRIALTFDDGPSEYTPQVLRVLGRYGVRATFFEIGEAVAADPAAARAVVRGGNLVGNHTWSHPELTEATTPAQLTRAEAAIRAATGVAPCLMRPPYGAASARVVALARVMGLNTIQWDVDPRDWSLPGARVIAHRVLAAAHPGAIVIMHDGGGPRAQTVRALRRVVPRLLHRGYRFVTVAGLLGLRTQYAYR